VPLPGPSTPQQAMATGTTGYTAMLSVLAPERYGAAPATTIPSLPCSRPMDTGLC